jgi:two-component system OmpR family response regulator
MHDLRLAVIAEDDAEVRDLIHLVLSQSGFTVVLAADGLEAIAAVREHEPLLTTLDVNMPGMDGFAVAKRLREFSRTYLIMITSLTSEVDIIRGFEAGADDYLVKPFRPRELRARADSMLRRAAYAESESEKASAPASGLEPAPPRQPDAEPEVSSWAGQAAAELRDASGTPTPYVGRRMPPAHEDQRATPAQPVQPLPMRVAAVPTHDATADQSAAPDHLLRFADLTYDTTTGEATVGDRALQLSQPESEILLSLLRTGRRVRSKADLVLAVRGQQYITSYFVDEADKEAVDGHIAELRRKLGDGDDAAASRYIETVKGVGFRMAQG